MMKISHIYLNMKDHKEFENTSGSVGSWNR